MNILIVDDQRAIVESLRDGISWEKLGIDEVYTACSAREAKLLLVNFDIQILLTDIEMPEEDGLSLFRWTRERFPELVGIFLTSHAEFSYAQDAISLGGMDYILQPARYGDVERVLENAVKKVLQTAKIDRLKRVTKMIGQQRDSLLELLLARMNSGKEQENAQLFFQLCAMFHMDYKSCVFWPVWIQVVRIAKASRWKESYRKIAFGNVLEELLAAADVQVCVSGWGTEDYLLFAAAEEGALTAGEWRQGISELAGFINSHMDFAIAVYPDGEAMQNFRPDRIEALQERRRSNVHKKAEIFWEDVEADADFSANEERIRAAVDYIKNNIGRNLSRLEVADMLHLNEEYFSRLFKRHMGCTFKDYETAERVSQAKKLLEYSGFSISIIASKVGYDNFSHFSRVFKKMTGLTPQEYRKQKRLEKEKSQKSK